MLLMLQRAFAAYFDYASLLLPIMNTLLAGDACLR